jgi:hypothetical protein
MHERARVDEGRDKSLISALHTRLLFILVHRIIAFVCGPLTSIHLLHHNLFDLHALAELLDWCSRWEDFLELRYKRRVDTVGEFDGKLDEHVTGLVVSQRGHTLPTDDLDIA